MNIATPIVVVECCFSKYTLPKRYLGRIQMAINVQNTQQSALNAGYFYRLRDI